jgi:hypothetical protein
MITSDPDTAQLIPGWMDTAARVETGNRQRVFENGIDTMNSDDEEAIEDVKPDEERNMYAAGMDPSKGPIKLSHRQAEAQRAAAAILKQQQVGAAPPRSQTPVNGSSDDDDPNGPDQIWSMSRSYWRQNKNKPVPPPKEDKGKPVTRSTAVTDPSSFVPPPEPERQPTPASSDTEDQWEMTEDQKRCLRSAKKKAAVPSRPPTPVSVPVDPPSQKGGNQERRRRLPKKRQQFRKQYPRQRPQNQ